MCGTMVPALAGITEDRTADRPQLQTRRLTRPTMFQTRKEHMSVQHNPTAFGDLRGWIEALAAHGELQEIDAEVDLVALHVG